MMRLTIAAVAFTFAAGYVTAEDKPKPTAEKLAGKWTLVKSSAELPEGLEASVEFTKDGKFTMKVKFKDQSDDQAGTYKLDGTKLSIEYTEGREKGKKESMEITKLTDDEFSTIDEEKRKDEFKKVKAK